MAPCRRALVNASLFKKLNCKCNVRFEELELIMEVHAFQENALVEGSEHVFHNSAPIR